MRGITQLFIKSPFGALKEHMRRGSECVDLVRPMFEALLDGNTAELTRLSKEVFKLEHRADEIKNEIRDNLPRSIFLPVDRTDLLNVLSLQDSIPDSVEDIAFLLTVRQTQAPESWRAPLLEYVDRSLETFRAAAEVIDSLENLISVGLAGPEAEAVLEKINQIGKMEWEADKRQFKMLQTMFKMEAELNPVDIFWWSKIFKEVGDLANYSERTTDRIRLMIYQK